MRINQITLIVVVVILSMIQLSCKSSKKVNVEKVEMKNIISNQFEGIVKYKYLMEDVSSLSEIEIENKIIESEVFLGRHIVYYIKENNAKSVINGDFFKMTTYTNESDSLYLHVPDMEGESGRFSTYADWNFKYDTIIQKVNAKIINGKNCDLIIFKSEDHTWKYYFNKEIQVNPMYYKHYQSGFWNEAIKIAKALPIRFEGKMPGSYIFMEAEEILSQKIEDSIFEIPNKADNH